MKQFLEINRFFEEEVINLFFFSSLSKGVIQSFIQNLKRLQF